MTDDVDDALANLDDGLGSGLLELELAADGPDTGQMDAKEVITKTPTPTFSSDEVAAIQTLAGGPDTKEVVSPYDQIMRQYDFRRIGTNLYADDWFAISLGKQDIAEVVFGFDLTKQVKYFNRLQTKAKQPQDLGEKLKAMSTKVQNYLALASNLAPLAFYDAAKSQIVFSYRAKYEGKLADSIGGIISGAYDNNRLVNKKFMPKYLKTQRKLLNAISVKIQRFFSYARLCNHPMDFDSISGIDAYKVRQIYAKQTQAKKE